VAKQEAQLQQKKEFQAIATSEADCSTGPTEGERLFEASKPPQVVTNP
jgi:hypothetical protein